MDQIKVKQNVLTLNQEPQLYGSMWLRYLGLRVNELKLSIFMDKDNKVVNKYHKDKTEKYCWIYSFINIETDKIIEFEFGYNDEFLKLTK